MKEYLKLLRIKHYVKNGLIFIPLFFAKEMFQFGKLWQLCIGFVCFSMVSSAVYIVNDLQDIEKDRNHPKKKNRPLASGKISKRKACFVMGICLLVSCTLSGGVFRWKGVGILCCYVILNLVYSIGLKNKPITDVVILASGFVLRVIYGSILAKIEISKWLYLVIITGSLYMGLGKRRNELKQQKNTRTVLKYYTETFLDRNMYACYALVIVFYALWTVESANEYMIWSVPMFLIVLMKYSLNIEGNSDGDPVDVLTQDKVLLCMVIAYAVSLFGLIYIL